MSVSDDLLDELIEIYEEECGVTLTRGEALEEAIALQGLFEAIYRAIPAAKQELFQKILQETTKLESCDHDPTADTTKSA